MILPPRPAGIPLLPAVRADLQHAFCIPSATCPCKGTPGRCPVIEAGASRCVRAIILFALKCAREPQGLTDEDYGSLRQHGLKQSEIMEVVAMSALAVYANIIADATGMEPDEMFGAPSLVAPPAAP